jgi:hypothetical protein
MSRAVLVALPTDRPDVADDFQERTQFFRPNQKRPTWKDVERERARSSTPADTRGSSQLAPVLRLAPKPESRPSSKPAAQLPPYLRKGYWNRDWLSPSAPLGERCHDAMRAEMGKGAEIRSCPPSLSKLLATPEWRGSTTRELTPGETISLKASATSALQDAQDVVFAAKGTAAKTRARAHVEAHEARLARVETALAVVHPSGAVLVWHPL